MVGGGGGTGGNGLLTKTENYIPYTQSTNHLPDSVRFLVDGWGFRSVFIGEGLCTVDLIGDVTLLSSFLGERLSDFNGELHRLSFFLRPKQPIFYKNKHFQATYFCTVAVWGFLDTILVLLALLWVVAELGLTLLIELFITDRTLPPDDGLKKNYNLQKHV